MKYLLIPTIIFCWIARAEANPVSFKDGWGIMPAYGRDWAEVQFNYSLTNRSAIGVSDYFRDAKDSRSNFVVGQFNYLVKRWNELESQANIYASVGLGLNSDAKHGQGMAGYGTLEADYETRRIYTLIAGETLQATNGVDSNRIRFRAGVAPYKAPFEALQTWLLLQVEYMPEMDESTRVTPLVRLFLNNYALEVGASLDGKPFLAAMAHF